MPKEEQTPPIDPLVNTDALHNPDDKGFKKIFSIKDTVLEYIHKFFPLLETYIEVDKLVTFNTNYVNKNFDEYFSDDGWRIVEIEPKRLVA